MRGAQRGQLVAGPVYHGAGGEGKLRLQGLKGWAGASYSRRITSWLPLAGRDLNSQPGNMGRVAEYHSGGAGAMVWLGEAQRRKRVIHNSTQYVTSNSRRRGNSCTYNSPFVPRVVHPRRRYGRRYRIELQSSTDFICDRCSSPKDYEKSPS